MKGNTNTTDLRVAEIEEDVEELKSVKCIFYNANTSDTEANRISAMQYCYNNFVKNNKGDKVMIRYSGGYYHAVEFFIPDNFGSGVVCEYCQSPRGVAYWTISLTDSAMAKAFELTV